MNVIRIHYDIDELSRQDSIILNTVLQLEECFVTGCGGEEGNGKVFSQT